MKLSKIIENIEFRTFVAMVKVVFNDDMGSAKIGELLRALPGVTTVTLVREERPGVEIFKVKLITQKGGPEAYNSFSSMATSKYSVVRVVTVAEKSIEEK
tara:strand:+ start:331 stop:630 length:300 start_codon:yes stop_codon:yes gene_type:complete